MKNYTGQSIFANYFVGMEGVGGKIFFSEDGMLFKSHKFNIQTGEIFIPYNFIDSVGKRNTMGIVPNGLKVITRDGKEHRFVIYHRKEVIEYLQSRI